MEVILWIPVDLIVMHTKGLDGVGETMEKLFPLVGVQHIQSLSVFLTKHSLMNCSFSFEMKHQSVALCLDVSALILSTIMRTLV